MALHFPEIKAINPDKVTKPHQFDKVKVAKKDITCRIPLELIELAKKQKLNVSRILANSLVCVFEGKTANPTELMENLFYDSFGKKIDRYNKAMERYDPFIKGIISRRIQRRDAKYERIGGIIEEKGLLSTNTVETDNWHDEDENYSDADEYESEE